VFCEKEEKDGKGKKEKEGKETGLFLKLSQENREPELLHL